MTPEVLAAVIVGASTVGAALVAGLFSALKKHDEAIVEIRETRSAIGNPNGMGNMIEMQERTLLELGRLSQQHDDLARYVHKTVNDVAAIQATLDTHIDAGH